MCGIDVEKSPGDAGILEHVFGSRFQSQGLGLREVKPARLILLPVKDRDGDDAAGTGLSALPSPLQYGHCAYRGRGFLVGIETPRVLTTGGRGQRKQ